MTQTVFEATPSSASFGKLKAKLWELFELDKADLDFGIYRILRARHKEIAEFLDKHLEKTVREALLAHGSLYQSQVEEDLRKAEQAAKDAGFNPEQSPRVLEIREKLQSGNDLDTLADEVYSHLYTFFSRYYQEGDFLGLQRSTVRGREKYMIPYNGEEVKLVWANMDQYYIKSSELLRDYVFQIAPGAGTLLETTTTERYTVHFKLVEADTEKDNRKPSGKTTRVFSLDDESSFVEDAPDTLTIRFRYREHTAERNLQDKHNADTEKILFDKLPANWKFVLFLPDPSYQGKDKKDTRTILQKHLRSYTANHQFDYFIHKDLGGFLRRELDFYIKNEVMYLDDIEEASAPKAEEYLSKIRALRRCALPIIRMLEQLENFQKKLWLKKKFVVETRYCMTLDRVPEKLYPEICANDAQWEEWEKLYALSEMFGSREGAKNTKGSQDGLFRGFAPSRDPEFLKANPYLMIDTRHFGRDFTLKLLASVEDLDETLDGVCFHSENFQALQLMQERYKEQVKCVYIDPPYNTGETNFAYKDGYRRSSWLSLHLSRNAVAKLLLTKNAVIYCHIDDSEVDTLKQLLSSVFGETNFQTQIAWKNKYGPGALTKGFGSLHEHILVFSKGIIESIEVELSEEEKAKYTGRDDRYDIRGGFITQPLMTRSKDPRPNLVYPLLHEGEEIWPDKQWIWERQRLMSAYQNDELVLRKTDGKWSVRFKQYLKDENGRIRKGKPLSLMIGPFNQDGTRVIEELFGERVFAFPKPVALGERFLDISVDGKELSEAIILDFYAGSGTTGHAVINLNRNRNSAQKYLLAEMGEYFDTVLVPRLKKVVYSTDWKDGKPQTRNTGISHAFKIVRLESYEDALNNLRLKRTPEQEAALKNAPEKARDQYLLGYFLDVESAGSASLLDLDQFRDPFAYKLKIATSSAGETVDTTVDLVETFNWLLGLKVKHIDAQKGFLTVTGEKRAGGRTLVIWRRLSDDPIADNKALEAFLGKIKVNPADTEFDYIYVNGSHTLSDPHNKIHLTEEAFQRLMFDVGNFESLE